MSGERKDRWMERGAEERWVGPDGPPVGWSATRVRLMEGCARSYGWQYVVGRGGWPGGPRSVNPDVAGAWQRSQRRPPLDIMRRAVVSTARAWLTEVHEGVEPSAGWIAQRAWRELVNEARRTGALGGDEHSTPPDVAAVADRRGWKRWVVHHAEALRRLEAFVADPWISSLASEPRRDDWMLLDRVQGVHIGGLRLHATPDLVLDGGGRWTLVRLASEASFVQPEARQQLELAVMLLWARSEPSLPLAADRYAMHRVAWIGHTWAHWHMALDAGWLEAAEVLVRRDVEQLEQIARRMGPFEQVERLPLARVAHLCRRCGHRQVCPGSGDLDAASAAQDEAAREEAQRAARWWQDRRAPTQPASDGVDIRQLTLPLAG